VCSSSSCIPLYSVCHHCPVFSSALCVALSYVYEVLSCAYHCPVSACVTVLYSLFTTALFNWLSLCTTFPGAPLSYTYIFTTVLCVPLFCMYHCYAVMFVPQSSTYYCPVFTTMLCKSVLCVPLSCVQYLRSVVEDGLVYLSGHLHDLAIFHMRDMYTLHEGKHLEIGTDTWAFA
jgi:hypothetical protein